MFLIFSQQQETEHGGSVDLEVSTSEEDGSETEVRP
jgi:hypothetical protein